MARKTGLSDALAKAAKGGSAAKAKGEGASRAKRVGASPDTAKPHRAGRINVTGYFDPAVKQSLRAIQARHPELTVQALLAEALNDLFAKHNVPQTARLGEEE